MNLKKLRKERGLSQAWVAKELGLSRTTYTKYENGVHDPSVATLIKMARLFEVPVDEVVGCEPPPAASPEGDALSARERRLVALFRRADPGDQTAVCALLGKYDGEDAPAPRPAHRTGTGGQGDIYERIREAFKAEQYSSKGDD